MMTQFNFPGVEAELLPLCRRKGMGVLAMKSVGDGYLHRSLRSALRYTLSLPVASVVLGTNSMDMLERDLKEADAFKPMTDMEREDFIKARRNWGITSAGSAAAARKTASTRSEPFLWRRSMTGRWTICGFPTAAIMPCA
jgi:hypothetical protein